MKKFTLIAVVSVLHVATALAGKPVPLALWSMNELTTTEYLHDSSGSGYDATAGSGVSIQPGLYGGAALFSGIGGEHGAKIIGFPALSNVTFSVWIYYTDCDNDYPRVFDCGDFLMHVTPAGISTAPLRFNINRPGGEGGFWNLQYKEFKANEWIHVAVSYDGSSIESVPVFYINGARMAPPTGSLPASPTFAGGDFHIGSNANADRPFGGMLDDFRVYDSVLTDEEVFDIYSMQPPVASAGSDQVTTRSEATLYGELINTNPFKPDYTAVCSWQQLEGEPAEIGQPGSVVSGVTLPVVGVYKFEFSVMNALESASYTTMVTRVVSAAGNSAPVVSAGSSDSSCAMPLHATMRGSVSDDGLPGSVQLLWSKASGPGGVFFDDPTKAETRAFFSAAGTYQIALVADDGDLQGSDTVTVVVSETVAAVEPTVAWWPISEGVTASSLVDVIGGRAMSLFDNPLLIPGKDSRAIRCTPITSYMYSATSADNIDNYDKITAALWINTALAKNSNPYPRIIQGVNWYWVWQPSGGGAANHRLGMVATDGTEVVWVSENVTLSANRWSHIAFTVDRTEGTSIKPIFYLDGKRLTSNAPAHVGGFRQIAGQLRIGGGSSERNLDAAVTDIRLYDYVLSEAEVGRLAYDTNNNHAPVIESGDLSYMFKTGVAAQIPVAIYDDNLPLASTLVSEWSVVEGESAYVFFDDASESETQIICLKSGTYKLRLSVSDGDFEVFQDFTVVSEPTGTVIMVM